MSERAPYLLVEDILEPISRIEEYTGGMDREEFLADRRTIDAVIRNFETIGEAASRLPLDFRHEHSKIDWRILIDFRNRLILILVSIWTSSSSGMWQCNICPT